MQPWHNRRESMDGAGGAGATELAAAAESYDIVVVGLGTAGSIAAIAAARHGLRVLGIDR
ncbi:MAG: dependent oxidoreductase, partial [Paenibacillaceae bacterium]|nr:dependent oxidoreductase [Paenibacillaceae bacterium]